MKRPNEPVRYRWRFLENVNSFRRPSSMTTPSMSCLQSSRPSFLATLNTDRPRWGRKLSNTFMNSLKRTSAIVTANLRWSTKAQKRFLIWLSWYLVLTTCRQEIFVKNSAWWKATSLRTISRKSDGSMTPTVWLSSKILRLYNLYSNTLFMKKINLNWNLRKTLEF